MTTTAEPLLFGASAIAAQHYLERTDLAEGVFNAAAAWWDYLDPNNIGESFYEVVQPGMIEVIKAGQAIAAAQTEPYMDALDDAYADFADVSPPLGKIDPTAFTGTAVDGRSLDTLLDTPVIRLRTLLSGGFDFTVASKAGLAVAQRQMVSEVQDAGREADDAASTAREYLGGGYRIINLPCCSRCAVLAGRFYSWDVGFERHPNCDCMLAPSPDGGDEGAGDFDLEDAIRDGQVTGLSKAEIDAILNEGASLSRIVGGHAKGMSVPRGAPGHRPTVYDIYQEAGDDRGEAVRLLLRMGYIVRT